MCDSKMSLQRRSEQGTALYLPDEILSIIFGKLDPKSLLNCMLVSDRFREIVEYCCQHFNLWEKVIEEVIDSSGSKFKEKSVLQFQDLFTCVQQWLNINNAVVTHRHTYTSAFVKSICVYKDIFVLVSNKTVNYYNINDHTLINTTPTKCLRYEENYAFSAEVAIPIGRPDVGNLLVLMNKLHKPDCVCTKGKKMVLCRAHLIKVHLNTCYIIDNINALRVFKADYCKWQESVLARHYGVEDSILDINIHKGDIYVLLRRGDVLYLDVKSRKFDKVYHLDTPLHNMMARPFTFHVFSQLFSVSHTEKMQIYPQDKEDQIVMACPGLACAIEHGPVLIIAYDNMKIEIYLTKKLRKNICEPELLIDMCSYLEPSQLDSKIKALDVHEDKLGHHLFVVTDTVVHEILISEKI